MKKFLVALGLSLLPFVALAEDLDDDGGGLIGAATGLTSVVEELTKAANALIPFFLAIAVVVFIYGVIKYILVTGAEEKSQARGYIIYGIIGIAVIISLFGVVKLLQTTFGVTNPATIDIPQFQADDTD
jgi:hypothetical protein